MKLRTVRHLMKDGVVNVIRQKMMSIATIFIVIASFLVLGIFLFLILNLNELSALVSKEPEIMVYCKYKLDDGQVYQVNAALKKMPEIDTITKVTKAEALAKIKQDIYEGREEAIAGLSTDFMPVAFIIKLKDPAAGVRMIAEIEKIQGVDVVKSPVEIVNMIVNAQSWIRIITMILVLVLLGISVLIISNAIKLTVHSRRKEVNIMKYIGATDAFIRLPFIMEGMIMGLIGSVLSFGLVSSLYNLFPTSSGLLNDGLFGQFKLVRLDDLIAISTFGIATIQVYLWIPILLGFMLIGTSMGALGSAISIKKYLKLK
ncbi:MAG: permease-like cell division protein FtsX [Clostridia bacterium]